MAGAALLLRKAKRKLRKSNNLNALQDLLAHTFKTIIKAYKHFCIQTKKPRLVPGLE